MDFFLCISYTRKTLIGHKGAAEAAVHLKFLG